MLDCGAEQQCSTNSLLIPILIRVLSTLNANVYPWDDVDSSPELLKVETSAIQHETPELAVEFVCSCTFTGVSID